MALKTKAGNIKEPLGPVNISVFEACIIGLVAALGAVLLKEGVGLLGTWRVQQVNAMGPFFLPVIGLAGGLISGLMVQYLANEIKGSGIAQTKGYLIGADIQLGFRTALYKLIACVISLGSGLALGREGPTVQVAAGLSAKISSWIRATPTNRNQLIAAGAGAGLAAAFNAPLAGALFVLEVLLQRMSGLAVGTTVVACFVAAVVSRLVGVQSLDIDFNDLAPKATFAYYDIPYFIILGILAGAFGALFNKTQISVLRFRRDVSRIPIPVATALAGLITGLILMHLPPFFANSAGVRELLVRGSADLHITAVAFLAQYFLTTIAFGASTPGGFFAPSLTLGAGLGHFVAAAQHYIAGHANVATFSIVGMGAAFCAIARCPMTAVVIIFEMTTDFNVVLPLMISCVLSYLVAEKFDPSSMYDQLLRLQGINVTEGEEVQGILYRLKANEVMTKDVEAFSTKTKFKEVLEVAGKSQRMVFPVVDEEQKLIGILSRSDIERARKKKLADDYSIKRIMTPKPVSVRYDESLAHVLIVLESNGIHMVPVVERSKLVGVITEEDIVRAESKAIGMKRRSDSSSYTVYQTRSPEAGVGRLLVAVADPTKAESLLNIAAKVAKEKQYELECLNVILISKEMDPQEARFSDMTGRDISKLAEDIGHKFKIPVHTNIRVSHDVGDAISDTIRERKINLFLMRWTGSKRDQKGDQIVKSVLRNTRCGVILLSRLTGEDRKEKYLVPAAEFLDASLAVELLPVVTKEEIRETINLCNVSKDGEDNKVNNQIELLSNKVTTVLDLDVEKSKIKATSNTRMLNEISKSISCDVLVIGLSRKRLVKSMNHKSFTKMISKGKSAVVLACRESMETSN